MPKPRTASQVRRSWRTPDARWAQIAPLLPPGKPHPLGCHDPRVDDRRAMDAIFFRLRTGCQWNALSATGLCSSSAAHRRFQEWRAAGVFLELWRRGLTEYDALKGIDWAWLALTEASGVPIGLAVAGANRHAVMLLAATLASVPVPRPRPTRRRPQGLCLGNAYDITWVYRLLLDAGCTPHVRGRREELVQRTRGHRARRWVVERTHSWRNRFRGLLLRWGKRTTNDEGSLHLACAYIASERAGLLGWGLRTAAGHPRRST